jgi:sugar phosphate isomerase/epimerase
VAAKPVDEVRAIFDKYREITGHSRAVLDDKRKRVIRARLVDGFTAYDLELAFHGCMFSPFHCGENDRQTRYDSITLILRDADQVERFRDIAERVIAGMKRRAEREQTPQQGTPEYDEAKWRDQAAAFLAQAKAMGVKARK